MKKVKLFSAFILMMTLFFVVGKSVQAESITQDTVWHKGEVHITNASEPLDIIDGATLTMEAGVVLKVGWNSIIRVRHGGKLIINGTEADPVIVTSLRDDAVGGDSNQDGGFTQPMPGDWHIY